MGYPRFVYKDGESKKIATWREHEEMIRDGEAKGWLDSPDKDAGKEPELVIPHDVQMERREAAFESKKQKMIDEELGKSGKLERNEPESGSEDVVVLEDKTVKELREIAEAIGLDFKKKATKAQLIDLIEGSEE